MAETFGDARVEQTERRAAATLTAPKRHGDGGGLWLSISRNGARRWVLLYHWRGKLTEMGLGSARTVSLARARDLHL